MYLFLINKNPYSKKIKIKIGIESKLWSWLDIIFIRSEFVGPWGKLFTNGEFLYYMNVLDHWAAGTYVDKLFVVFYNTIIS